MSSIGSTGLSASTLLSYFQAQLQASPTAVAAQNVLAGQSQSPTDSATANDNPPWNKSMPVNNADTAKVLSTTNFINTSNVPLTPGATSDSKLEQDNQNLFSLYGAVNSLNYLAQLAQNPKETAGQLVGLNTRFQTGLTQVQNFLANTKFNNYTLQAQQPAASVTSTAAVPLYRQRHLQPPSNSSPIPRSTIRCRASPRPAVSPSG